MPLTRADRVALHKKQERISLKSGEVPDVSDLKEGVPVIRTNHQGVIEYIRHNNVLYTRAYTAVGEGGVESSMTAVTNSMEFTPGSNQMLSRMIAGSLDRPNLDLDVLGDLNITSEKGDISLRPKGAPANTHVYLKNGSSTTVDFDCNGSNWKDAGDGASMTFHSIADSGDYFRIDAGTHGSTLIKTVDDDGGDDADLTLQIDGDVLFVPTKNTGGSVIIDKDWDNTTATSLYGLQIDFDKEGISTAGTNNMYGLTIDMDNTTAEDGINNMFGIACTPTLTHAADAGTPSVYGGIFTTTGASNGTSTATGLYLTTSGADTNIGMVINQTTGTHLKLQKDANDYATFTVADTGDLTIATTGDGSLDSDLILDIDGDLFIDSDSGYVYLQNGGYTRGSIEIASGSAIVKYRGTTNGACWLQSLGTGDIVIDADGGNITLQDGGSTYTPTAASDAVTKTYGDTQTVINNTTYVRAHNLTWYLFAGDQTAWLGGTDTSVSDTETISLSRAVLDTLWFIVPYNMTIHAISGSVCDDDMSAHPDKYIGIWTIDSLSTSGNDPGDVGGSQAFTLRYITAAFGGSIASLQAFHDTGADFALTAGQGVFLGYVNGHSGGLDDVTLNCTIWAHQTTP